MADVLENILELKRKSLERAKEQVPLDALEVKAKSIPLNSFVGALSDQSKISVIAEMKRKSPSAGIIREPYDVPEIAKAYKDGGASAISVLAEEDFFGGSIADLVLARENSGLPILRKDFIFDPYQIVEAKAFGADAVLLIADMLSKEQLKELVACADAVKIDCLVEVFTSDVLPQVINTGVKVIGINSRNLRTLEMTPENIIRLSQMVSKDRIVVAESGIKTAADVENLKALNIGAILVGESLLKQQDLQQAVQNLVQAGKKEAQI